MIMPNTLFLPPRMSIAAPILAPVFAAALLVAGCSQEAQETPTSLASEGSPVPTVAAPSEAGAAQPGAARHVKQSNELFEFDYAYPAAAGVIPDLKKMLDTELEKSKAELAENAEEQRAAAKKEGFPYRPLGNWVEWKVVTDLPGWLSLSADISDYQGGAHPNHGFDALVWDKQANRKREAADFFSSEEALSRAIRKDFCAALDRERAKKRGGQKLGGSIPEFEQCIDPTESTVILGSSNRHAFDRIGVLVAPYEAGPYAEGSYEVTLPVTEAVLAAVKPEYRSAFAAKR